MMLKEFIEKILEISMDPSTTRDEVYGLEYQYTGAGLQPVEPPKPKVMDTYTLEGILQWFERPECPEQGSDDFFIHVESHKAVHLRGVKDDYQQRYHLMRASFQEDGFPYRKWMAPEDFIIQTQTKIMDSPAKSALIEMVSRIRGDEVKMSEDNGLGQVVTVVNKVGRLEDKETTPMVMLAPRRTFAEAKQPESPFLLRMRHIDGETEVCLFEADCGAWKVAAVDAICEYLNDHSIVKAKGISIVG
jgi:hypothetical protein